ncbi:GNAT family N-acetyltransferase [Fluviibacterium sp. DFM31]|uniref:GNAT family N-acetyltransferase n=1 Tax=Meridianimarinicoccus marinus TaxID=3231483 RepID=A0ABV3L4J4_9RHOB
MGAGPVGPSGAVIAIAAAPDPTLAEDQLRQHLIADNRRVSTIGDQSPVVLEARNRAGHLLGGVAAVLWGQCLEIDLLWVDPDGRGQGIGSWLLADLERRARAQGGRRAFVNTFSFQAPTFYRRAGYREVYRQDGFGDGTVSKVFFEKDLG